jgi:preprotein translocase subunit SecG
MSLVETILLTLHVLVAIAVCGFVLLQHGKGADMGAAFGGGASGTVFGARGSANFLSHTTALLAAVFFVTSLGLTWYMSSRGAPKGLMEVGAVPTAPAGKAAEVPVAPGTAPAVAPGLDPTKGQAPIVPPSSPAGSKAGDVPK